MSDVAPIVGDPFLQQQHGRLRALLQRVDALATAETPLLVLEPARVQANYTAFQTAMPGVHHHYAMKALAHPAVIEALAAVGGYFDVATPAEVELLAGVLGDDLGERAIHTHPYKKPTEIEAAWRRGVRIFVVDSPTELRKMTAWPGARVLIRLGYSNPYAQVDLSARFGATHAAARELLAEAQRLGVHVAGFSYHPGSQLTHLETFISAATQTRAFIEALEAEGHRFELLDMGGGFPAPYTQPELDVAAIAAAVMPILQPLQARMTLLSEPGRAIVANAMTLLTSVVGVSTGATGTWYTLDDGTYGSYSNIIFEHIHPYIISERQLLEADVPLQPVTLGGPTCDSSDVIARNLPLPDLQPGDRLLSPGMGAYTAVTATEFNGIPRASVLVI